MKSVAYALLASYVIFELMMNVNGQCNTGESSIGRKLSNGKNGKKIFQHATMVLVLTLPKPVVDSTLVIRFLVRVAKRLLQIPVLLAQAILILSRHLFDEFQR